jgi:hypothetical protein
MLVWHDAQWALCVLNQIFGHPRVAGKNHGMPAVVDAIPECRCHGPVVDEEGRYADTPFIEDDALFKPPLMPNSPSCQPKVRVAGLSAS